MSVFNRFFGSSDSGGNSAGGNSAGAGAQKSGENQGQSIKVGPGQGDVGAGQKEDNYDNLWENPPSSDNSGKSDNNQSQGKKPTFDEHMESLNLMQNFDSDAFASAISSGNKDAVSSSLKSLLGNVYKAAIKDAHSMVQTSVSSAIDESVKKSSGNYKTDMLVQDMHAALPFTKDTAIKPVAQLVLSRLLGQGMSNDKAIIGVGKYFQHISKQAIQETEAAQSKPGSRGFSPKETDWAALLDGSDTDS